jgi:hypothetical protein
MKLVQLKKECENEGLSKTGRKAELVKRLLENLKQTQEADSADVPAEVEKTEPTPPEKTEVASSNQAEVKPASAAETDEEKLAARKARFGITSADEKMKVRQARFGTAAKATGVSKEKLAARAKRFGIPASADPSKLVSEELKRKRMERFGVVDQEERVSKRQKRFATGKKNKSDTLPPLPVSDKAKEEAKKKTEARKQRFNTSTSTDKMKARQARFATS